MTEQLNDALTEEQREEIERARVALGLISEQIMALWILNAKRIAPFMDVMRELMNSDPMRRGVLAGKVQRFGRVAVWLAWRVPMPVVKWLNERIGVEEG